MVKTDKGVAHSNYSWQSIFLFLAVLVLTIVFETFQQWYYIDRYNLADNIRIASLFRGHFISWLIWLGYMPIIAWMAHNKSLQGRLVYKDYAHFLITILGTVGLCIMTIAMVRIMMADDLFSWHNYIREYVSFFFFQKSPVYTLSYLALAFVFYLNYKNITLQFRLQELSELRNDDLKLYQELRAKHPEKAQILIIKVGNKQKIVPVAEICWVESDDYCVKIHTIHGKSFTMRSTLKSLEEQLQGNFMRVHRTAIVNLDFTKEISYSANPNLTLLNNSTVPVSKSKIRALRSQMS